MKKLFVLLIALALFASVLCSCGGGNKQNYEALGKYDLNTYLDYYWDSEAIYHESYLPLSSKERSAGFSERLKIKRIHKISSPASSQKSRLSCFSEHFRATV